MKNLRIQVAIVQAAPIFLNLAESVTKAVEFIQNAARAGARIIVFPETWLPGYPVWLDEAPGAALWDYAPAKELYRLLVDNAVSLASPELARLCVVAREVQAYVVMGAHEVSGGSLYNSMFYLKPDGTVAVHRKLIPTYSERLIWAQGDGSTLAAVPTEFGALGGLICWEHWMPLARAAMHAQNETIHVAQWPTVKELHQLASRHYAFEGQCFVLAAGTILTVDDLLLGFESLNITGSAAEHLLKTIPGPPERWLMRGGSAMIAPNAEYIISPTYEKSAILYADLPSEPIVEGHLTMDSNGHYARPDVFELRVHTEVRSGVRFTTKSG